MTTNQQLAQRVRQLAARQVRGSLDRAACLVAAVALGESRTVTGARQILAQWGDGPPDIRDRAGTLLAELLEEEPDGQG